MCNQIRTLIIIAFLAHCLLGCQTYQLIHASMNARGCETTIKTSSAYKIVAEKWDTMIGVDEPTPEKLADPTHPTPSQVDALVSVHNDLSRCRQQIVEDYSKALPVLIPTVVESYKQADIIDSELIRGDITWGDANRKYMEGKREMKKKVEFVLAHEEEIERQSAEETWNSAGRVVKGILAVGLLALQSWSIQQQTLYASSRYQSRMVSTTCSIDSYGSSIRCLSN